MCIIMLCYIHACVEAKKASFRVLLNSCRRIKTDFLPCGDYKINPTVEFIHEMRKSDLKNFI